MDLLVQSANSVIIFVAQAFISPLVGYVSACSGRTAESLEELIFLSYTLA